MTEHFQNIPGMIRFFVFVFFVSCGESPKGPQAADGDQTGSTSPVGAETGPGSSTEGLTSEAVVFVAEGGGAVEPGSLSGGKGAVGGGTPSSSSVSDKVSPVRGDGDSSLVGAVSEGAKVSPAGGGLGVAVSPDVSLEGVTPSGGEARFEHPVQEGLDGSVSDSSQAGTKLAGRISGQVQVNSQGIMDPRPLHPQQYYLIHRAGAFRVLRIYNTGWNFKELLQSECLVLTESDFTRLKIFWGYRAGGNWKAHCSNREGAIKCGGPGHYALTAGFFGDLVLTPLGKEPEVSQCRSL